MSENYSICKKSVLDHSLSFIHKDGLIKHYRLYLYNFGLWLNWVVYDSCPFVLTTAYLLFYLASLGWAFGRPTATYRDSSSIWVISFLNICNWANGRRRAGRGQWRVSAEWLPKFAVRSLGDRTNKIWSCMLLLNSCIGRANPKWLQADISSRRVQGAAGS
jgi:hypothetical protein